MEQERRHTMNPIWTYDVHLSDGKMFRVDLPQTLPEIKDLQSIFKAAIFYQHDYFVKRDVTVQVVEPTHPEYPDPDYPEE
jgi:hypothetical protein